VLTDPKNDFAAQNIIPLVYKKGVTPAIVAVLNEISAKLTTTALIQLNTELSGSSAQSYQQAAESWLTSVGIPFKA
jgi:osmoprotectant transport system substrate-binding protein